MATKNLIPRGSGEGGIGIPDTVWGYGYYETGNFNKGLFVSGKNIDEVIADAVTGGGLGGVWDAVAGGIIYYNGGNVGIGTTTPGAKLEVCQDLDTSSGASILKVANTRLNTGTSSSVISLITDEVDGSTVGERVQLAGSYDGINGGKLDILTSDGSSLSPAVTIKHNGNVGIGTTSPSSPLTVSKVHTDGSSGIDNLITLAASEKSGQDLEPGDGVGILFKVPVESEQQNIGARIAGVRQGGTDTASSTELTFEVSQNDETLDEAMRIDRDGNVGIGTTNPATALDINKELGDSSPIITLSRGGVSKSRFAIANATGSILAGSLVDDLCLRTEGGNIRFGTALATKTDVSILSNGNVGIGTTNPDHKLHMSAIVGESPTLLGLSHKSSTSEIKFTTNEGATNESVSFIQAYNNNLRFFVDGGTEPDIAITIRANGSFELNNIPSNNNSTSGSKMTSAAFSISAASSSLGTGNSKDIGFSWGPVIDTSAGAADYTIDNTDLVFGTINTSGNPAEIAKFSHTGQVRIGLKSEEMIINGTNPTQYRNYGEISGGTLEIRDERNKNATNAHFRIVGGSVSATTGSHYIDNTGGAKYIISQDIVGGEIRMISSSGGVKLTSGSTGWVNASSDKRSKENVSPLENVLDKVLKLSPSRYDYKEEYGNKDQIGFIAQDVEEVLPEFYIPGSTEEEMSTVKFSDNATTALLVKAIQEQQQLIEDLKSRIETLENK